MPLSFISTVALATGDLSFHNHSNIEVLRSEVKAQEAEAKSGRAQIWPELSFVGGYAEENVLHEPKKGAVAYLNVDWTLFDGGKSWGEAVASRSSLVLSRLHYERQKRDLFLSQFRLQNELLRLKELAKIESIEVSAYQDQLVAAKKRVSSGLTSEADILELEIRQQETREHVLELNQMSAQIEAELQALGDLLSEKDLQFEESSAGSGDLLNRKFEQTHLSRQIAADLEVVSAQAWGNYSPLLPEIVFNAQYGVIDPQDYTLASKKESALGILLKWSLFSGGKNWNAMQAKRNQNFAKDHRLRMDLRLKSAEFKIKQSRLLELQRLIEVHQVLADKTQRLMSLVSSEFRRGVKGTGEWMEVTEKWVSVRKKLLDLNMEKTNLEKELQYY